MNDIASSGPGTGTGASSLYYELGLRMYLGVPAFDMLCSRPAAVNVNTLQMVIAFFQQHNGVSQVFAGFGSSQGLNQINLLDRIERILEYIQLREPQQIPPGSDLKVLYDNIRSYLSTFKAGSVVQPPVTPVPVSAVPSLPPGWNRFFDPTKGTYYYYDQVNNRVATELPRNIVPAPRQLPQGWEQHPSANGPFYFNTVTKSRQWQFPVSPAIIVPPRQQVPEIPHVPLPRAPDQITSRSVRSTRPIVVQQRVRQQQQPQQPQRSLSVPDQSSTSSSSTTELKPTTAVNSGVSVSRRPIVVQQPAQTRGVAEYFSKNSRVQDVSRTFECSTTPDDLIIFNNSEEALKQFIWRQDPFIEVKRKLAFLPIMPNTQFQRQQKVPFVLNSETVSAIQRKELVVNMRVFSFTEMMDIEPVNSFAVFVNSFSFRLPDKPRKLRSKNAKPLVTSRYLDISKCIRVGVNNLCFQPPISRAVLVIQLCRVRPFEEVLEEIKKRPPITHDSQKEDDDVKCAEEIISLHCPLTLARIVTPVKGTDCTHETCFDLEGYLRFCKQTGLWECPVCFKGCPASSLRLDVDFQKILNSAPKEADSVLLQENGFVVNNPSLEKEVRKIPSKRIKLDVSQGSDASNPIIIDENSDFSFSLNPDVVVKKEVSTPPNSSDPLVYATPRTTTQPSASCLATPPSVSMAMALATAASSSSSSSSPSSVTTGQRVSERSRRKSSPVNNPSATTAPSVSQRARNRGLPSVENPQLVSNGGVVYRQQQASSRVPAQTPQLQQQQQQLQYQATSGVVGQQHQSLQHVQRRNFRRDSPSPAQPPPEDVIVIDDD